MKYTLLAIYEGTQKSCQDLEKHLIKIKNNQNIPLKIQITPSNADILHKFIHFDEPYIYIPVQHGIQKISFHKLYYAETNNHQIILHYQGEHIIYNGSLKKLEQFLPEHGFFRCNNSYIVNIQHIECIVSDVNRYAVILSTGERLPLSRNKKSELLDLLSLQHFS